MIVVAADTHLYPYTWASLPQVRGDSYNSFNQIIEYCVKNKSEGLVLAGDVFDGPPTPDAVRFFLDSMDVLDKAHIRVMAIQGQHGMDKTLSWASIDKRVIDLEKMTGTTSFGPMQLRGFDRRTPDELKTVLEKLDSTTNVLVLHQLCRGTVPEIEGRNNWDFDPAWVPATVKLVLLGDFHEPWQLKRGNTLFIYTGSTCMQKINEPVEKSFLTVDPPTLDVRRVPLKTRPFVSYLIMDDAELQKTTAHAFGLASETLVHVKFDPRLGDVESAFRKINNNVHYMFRPISIETVVDEQDQGVPTDVSLESCLSTVVSREWDAQFYSFMISLLRSKDLNNTLDAFKADILRKTKEM